MDLLAKKEHLSSLFDFYELLLTEKQREYFRYYYFEDYSLAEIANIYGVSRSAIYDLLQKTFNLLETYESKLGLYSKFKQRQNLYKKFIDCDNPEIKKLISELKKIE